MNNIVKESQAGSGGSSVVQLPPFIGPLWLDSEQWANIHLVSKPELVPDVRQFVDDIQSFYGDAQRMPMALVVNEAKRLLREYEARAER
jgi:hypothetical protein